MDRMRSAADRELNTRGVDRGFTLVEILIAIVLIGTLSAVVVVGISNLTDKGSSAACSASLDASKSGSIVFFTSSGAYPTTLLQMTSATPPSLVLSRGVSLNAAGNVASGSSWNLTIVPGATGAAPTFWCTSAGVALATAIGGTTACPGPYANWVGEYYSNKTLTGAPARCRHDATVNFDWATGIPATGIPADDFSVRWKQTVTLGGAATTFRVTSDDGVRVSIDGVILLNNWTDHAALTQSFVTTPTAGAHTVIMEFYERGGSAVAKINWA